MLKTRKKQKFTIYQQWESRIPKEIFKVTLLRSNFAQTYKKWPNCSE